MSEEVKEKRGLLPCPFCGTVPALPSGLGTQYEIECCDCGSAVIGVQICDLMTLEERQGDNAWDEKKMKHKLAARLRAAVGEKS